MKLFYKYEQCLVLSFPAFGKYKIEIVYAPPGYSIKPHTHPYQDIKLILLFGHDIKFFRQKPGGYLISFHARVRHVFKTFTICANDIHYFRVSRWPLIFINFERWKSKPTSAAIDLTLVKN